MDKGRRGEACIHIMGRARILHGSGSRGVSRRIDERITGYTQSAGFEGCIESWICARRECACAGAGALRGLDYGSREEAISGIPGEADSAAAYRPKIEIERIGPDCFPPWNSCFRGRYFE